MSNLKRVLFLCTGNSARSQMAEGLMKSLGSGKWDVKSGGTFPSYVHPLAIEVMKEIGIDISQQTSKSINHFVNEEFDYIVTLCDEAALSCPVFPEGGKRIHWSLENPAAVVGSIEKRLAVFRRLRGEIKRKIDELLESEG